MPDRYPQPTETPSPNSDVAATLDARPVDARNQLPLTIGVEDAGRLLGMCRTSAYRAAQRGEIPTIRLNGRLHVPTARLLALLGHDVDPADELRQAS